MADPDATAAKPLWNSLEVTKVVIAALTPFTLLILGQQFTAASQERSVNEARASKVVEKRVQLWDRLAMPLNDIYAYMMQVGQWKELNERDIIAPKRQADAIIHANRPFFSDEFYGATTAIWTRCSRPFRASARMRS
jgi:hypothetical protein